MCVCKHLWLQVFRLEFCWVLWVWLGLGLGVVRAPSFVQGAPSTACYLCHSCRRLVLLAYPWTTMNSRMCLWLTICSWSLTHGFCSVDVCCSHACEKCGTEWSSTAGALLDVEGAVMPAATTCHTEIGWTTLWGGCRLTGAGPHSVRIESLLPSTGSRCYHRSDTGGSNMRRAVTLQVTAPWSATHCDITCWSTGIWEPRWRGMLLAHWRRRMGILEGRDLGGCWLLQSRNVPLTSYRRSMPGDYQQLNRRFFLLPRMMILIHVKNGHPTQMSLPGEGDDFMHSWSTEPTGWHSGRSTGCGQGSKRTGGSSPCPASLPLFGYLNLPVHRSKQMNGNVGCSWLRPGWSYLLPGDDSQTIASHRSSVDGHFRWGTQQARIRAQGLGGTLVRSRMCVRHCIAGLIREGWPWPRFPSLYGLQPNSAPATPRSSYAEYQRWDVQRIRFAAHCARQNVCTSGLRMMSAHCKYVNKYHGPLFQAYMRHTCPPTYCKVSFSACNIGGRFMARYLPRTCSCGSMKHCEILCPLPWRLRQAQQAVTPVAAWLSICPLSLQCTGQHNWPASEMETSKAAPSCTNKMRPVSQPGSSGLKGRIIFRTVLPCEMEPHQPFAKPGQPGPCSPCGRQRCSRIHSVGRLSFLSHSTVSHVSLSDLNLSLRRIQETCQSVRARPQVGSLCPYLCIAVRSTRLNGRPESTPILVSSPTTGWWSPWIRLLRWFGMHRGFMSSSGKVISMPWIRLAEPSTRRGSTERCAVEGYFAQFTHGCLGQMTRSHPWARFKWRQVSRRQQSRCDKASSRAYRNKWRPRASLWSIVLQGWSRSLYPAWYRYRSPSAKPDVLEAWLCLCCASITSPQTSHTGCLPNPFIYLLGILSADGGLLSTQPECTQQATVTAAWPQVAPNAISNGFTSSSRTEKAGTPDTHFHISSLASRSGPKSGGVRCILLFLAQIRPLLSVRVQERPSFPDTNTRVADHHTISGSRLFHSDSSFARTAKHSAWRLPVYTPARKRAYHRACSRGASSPQGGTMYRGKWCTVDTLNAQRNLPIIKTTQRAPPRVATKRLRIVSLNTGPLSTASYDELMLWMSDYVHTLDLVLIQECGWPNDVEYSTDDWHIVYSGAGHKGQGVMVCVNRRLCPMAEAIRWRSVIPGRLLHVRVTPPRAGCSIDVCCVYQHVWSPQGQTAVLLQKRDSVWQALSLLITQIPVRNTLICAGDFNTTLHSSTNWVGPAVRPPKTRPVDQDRFQQLVETHDLIATNTWTAVSKAHTFSSHQGCTQLDYILCRRACVDHQARHACPEHHMSLFAWQQGGRHFPVFGSLPLRTYQGSRHPADNKSESLTSIPYDKEALCRAIQHHTEDAQRLQHVIHHLLETRCPTTPEGLNNLLMQAMADIFPKRPGPRPAPAKAWHSETVQAPIREMWLHHRRARMARVGSSLGSLFRAWVHTTRFQAIRKQVFRAGRQRRRAMYQDQVDIAYQAAQQGDQRTLYQVIRRLAPKTLRQRVQLHAEDGSLLSDAQELQIFHQHCQDLFQSSAPAVAAPALQEPYQLGVSTLNSAILALKPHKATPSHTAPTVVWQLCSYRLAECLAGMVATYWKHHPQVPHLWSDAWIIWLRKPGKVPLCPADLRPIALQDTGGKAIAKVLQQHLRPVVQRWLAASPQYAYLPGRSLDIAISRVLCICGRVRDRLQAGRLTLQQRKRGMQPRAQIGGVIFSCDLSQAFDRAQRADICHALTQAGAPPDLVSLIAHFHNDIRYHLTKGSRHAEVRCGRGVRQGCLIAPLLWDALTGLILQRLEERIGASWVNEFVNMFADDLLAIWEIGANTCLWKITDQLQQVVLTLQSLGLKINAAKSKMVIAVKGYRAKQWQARHVKLDRQGQPFFHLSMPGNHEVLFPVCREVPYLGVIISFGGYEMATLKHRLRQAEGNRFRLQRLLQGRHVLTREQRLRLWICVCLQQHDVRPTFRRDDTEVHHHAVYESRQASSRAGGLAGAPDA